MIRHLGLKFLIHAEQFVGYGSSSVFASGLCNQQSNVLIVYFVFSVDIPSLSLISLLCGKQVELRDVDTGNKLNLRFGSEESVESMLFIP